MAEERVQRHLAAILAADVVGYSRLMEQDEAGTFARLRAHRKELFEPKIAWQSICQSKLEDVMEHKTLNEIRNVADILPSWLRARPLSKCERLERWAEALDREGERRLHTLFEMEYAQPAERAALRADDSPLSVAFNDPRLRAEGLAGDTVGDAIGFFGISERELHNILCFCHHGDTMLAEVAAARVRFAAGHRSLYAPQYSLSRFVAVLIAIGALTV